MTLPVAPSIDGRPLRPFVRRPPMGPGWALQWVDAITGELIWELGEWPRVVWYETDGRAWMALRGGEWLTPERLPAVLQWVDPEELAEADSS